MRYIYVYSPRLYLQAASWVCDPCGKLTMNTPQKRKISEENREFNSAWTDSFAFTANDAALPVCLICGEKLANIKKCNVERHFQNKH